MCSSPMCTSEQTSDSSDTGGSRKSSDDPNSDNKGWDASSEVNSSNENVNQPFRTPEAKKPDEKKNFSMVNNNDDTMKSDNVCFHFIIIKLNSQVTVP